MFFILLLLALAASYYIAGLFKLDDVTIQNYQDKLAYILMHPFRNWFNRKTPAVIGIALTAWAMFVCYYLTYYRNFHPDAELVLQNGQMYQRQLKGCMEKGKNLLPA